MKSNYYHVTFAEQDKLMMACMLQYGAYEFFVMSFGFRNVSVTFCTQINKVLQPFLDQFVVVYLDNIVVYSQKLEENIDHLRQAFMDQWDNSLHVKREKHAFAKKEILFLFHITG